MISVGVVGNGFVGGTCSDVFSETEGVSVKVFDKDPKKTKNTFDEVCKCDIVFVAVPTPMDKNGRCHTKIVEEVVEQTREKNKENLIVIKSTVPPGTTKRLNEKYGNICFNPEFLTEKNSYFDFKECDHVIIGTEEFNKFFVGENVNIKKLIDLYSKGIKQNIFNNLTAKRVFVTDTKLAELVKYVRNTYLATRLTFFNTIYDICEKINVRYEDVKFLTGQDSRIGNHYNRIDPKNRPAGGTCLPKDLSALIQFCENVSYSPALLKSVQEKNLELAGKSPDWEGLEGRAVVKKEE